MSLPATDAFAGTGALSGSWTVQLGTPQRVSSHFASPSGTENTAFWNADAFNNDQYAQCVLNNGLQFGGPIVRASGTAGSSQFYWALGCSVASGGTGVLYKYVTGSYTSLGTFNTDVGHTSKLQIVGSGITLFDNGVSILTASDAGIVSGSAGLGGYGTAAPLLDTWQADNVGGGGTTISPTGAALVLAGATALLSLGLVPSAAALSLIGGTPSLAGATQLSPTAATLALTGGTPTLGGVTTISPSAAALALVGGTPSLAATTAITLNTVSDFSTGNPFLPWQRNINGTPTDMVFHGGYSGSAPISLEGSIDGGAYAALTSFTASGGTWTGTVVSLLKGEHALLLRVAADHTITTPSTLVVVGDWYAIAGDSIAAGQNISGQFSSGANHSWNYHPNTNQFFRLDLITEVGYYPLLGTLLAADQTCPMGFINGGSAGTSIGSWNSGTYPDGLAAQITASLLNSVRGTIWHIGTNDCAAPGRTRAATAAGLLTDVTYLNGVLPSPSPTHVFAIFGEVLTADVRADIDQTRLGILDAVTAATGSISAVLIEEAYPDHLHPINSQAQAIADRVWMALKDACYSGSLGRGPRESKVGYSGAVVTVTLDQAISNAGAVSGYRVTDNGTPSTLNTQTVSGTQATITTNATLVGPVLVSFASNNDAAGATVPLSLPITMPDARTVSRPAEPFIDVTAQQGFLPSGAVLALTPGTPTITLSRLEFSPMGATLTLTGGKPAVSRGGVGGTMVPQLRLRRAVLPA